MRARSMQTPIPGGTKDRTLHELQKPDRSRASHTQHPNNVASSSTCPIFVARDLSALFLLRTRTCPARNAAMEACHPAWFRYVRGIRPPRHCDCVRSHLPVCSLCLEKPKNLITSADAAPVDMWTTLFALSTYPQAGAARLATLPPTAPMAAAACGRRNGWTNGRHRHP